VLHGEEVLQFQLPHELLAAYIVLNANWKFTFLRPTLEEIVAEYLRMHGPEPPAEEQSDEEQEGDDGEGSEEGAEGA